MYKRSQDEKSIAKLFKNASVIEQFSDVGNIFYLESKDLMCLSCLKLYFKKLLNRNLQLSDFKDVSANKLLFVGHNMQKNINKLLTNRN